MPRVYMRFEWLAGWRVTFLDVSGASEVLVEWLSAKAASAPQLHTGRASRTSCALT